MYHSSKKCSTAYVGHSFRLAPNTRVTYRSVPPSIWIYPYFMGINEILLVKSAELRIFKHPIPPLFMHVHSV